MRLEAALQNQIVLVGPMYIRDDTFYRISKHAVYTKGKTPDETGQEILKLCS